MKYTLNDFDGDARAAEQVEEGVVLMRGVAEGDRECFDRLYQMYAPLVYSVVQRVLQGRADTEEVVQEVFVSLWERAGQFSTKRGKPSNWIGTMARNRAIDRLRANRRRSLLSERYENEHCPGVERETPRADVLAAEADERSLVVEAMADLSPEQREALEATYLLGMTQREAAKRLGHPLGTLKARVRRALVVMRENLTNRVGAEGFEVAAGV